MSYIAPEVFHYSGQPYTSSIPNQEFRVQAPELLSNATGQPYQNIPRQLGNFGQSQVNNVFRPINYTPPSQAYLPSQSATRPQTFSQDHQRLPQNQPQGKKVRQEETERSHEGAGKINERYDEYLQKGKEEEYKYNIFSIMDEPWNRCMTGEKCGKFPSNQCIASSTYRKYWS